MDSGGQVSQISHRLIQPSQELASQWEAPCFAYPHIEEDNLYLQPHKHLQFMITHKESLYSFPRHPILNLTFFPQLLLWSFPAIALALHSKNIFPNDSCVLSVLSTLSLYGFYLSSTLFLCLHENSLCFYSPFPIFLHFFFPLPTSTVAITNFWTSFQTCIEKGTLLLLRNWLLFQWPSNEDSILYFLK